MPRGVEVPLRCREETVKSRAAVAGRRTMVWAALGVCSVMLVKAVVIGGLGSATFSLLDPRYGGVDGLGVLTAGRSEAPARQQELAAVGRSLDTFRTAQGLAGTVPSHEVQGSVFGDDAPGKLPGVNQNAWLASRTGQGVHFFSSKPHFVRAAPHPRRPSMLHRFDHVNVEGALANMRTRRTPNALARIVSRDHVLRERARLAGLNEHDNALGVLGRLQSAQQPTTRQFLKSADEFDNSAGGALFRASTTATSTGGSLSPQFHADAGNTNGALAAVHGDKSWAAPTNDNGWAQAVRDNAWAAPTNDNGWAAASKQTGWASAVHDNGWATSPSAAASHGALMSVKNGNPMGSLAQLKGRQDDWAKSPGQAEDMGALANMWSGNSMGSLAAVHGGENGMGSLAHTRDSSSNTAGSLAHAHAHSSNMMGSLSMVKGGHGNSKGSLASVKTDPETNGALANFKEDQAATDGSLSSFKDNLDATDGSLASLKASNYAGSLANTKGSDAGGSLADTKGSDSAGSLSEVKGSDVWGSLANSKGKRLVNGVLSVTKNTEDVGGSLSGFTYGKAGEQVGGSLANAHGSDVGGSLANVKGAMVNGALAAVGGKHDESEMVDGSLSAVRDRVQGLGWLAQAPGLRGRLVERGAGDVAAQEASKKTTAKGAVQSVTETAKQVQKTEEDAAALKYMLGKELNEAAEKRAALAAEKKVTEQEQALEHLLKASKEKVEKVQAKMEKAAAQAAKAAKAAKAAQLTSPPKAQASHKDLAAATKAVGKGADARGKTAARANMDEATTKSATSVHENTMHVAKGQQKKQQKLDQEGGALDNNEDDIGWHKHHWSTLAWVMFIMFGPVFTTAVVGLVGYYTGTVAALATCLLLVCMDIACYYYSWFLW